MDAARIRTVIRLITAALALGTVGIALASPRRLHGAEVSCVPAVPDVWVVSTRGLPDVCRLPESVNFHVQRLRPDGTAWEQSDVASLLDDRTAACAAGGIRTVIYSWPSEQQGILLKDGRAKYQRAFSEGRYLAWLLGQLEPDRPIAIVGYSFGAIITLEAIEDLVMAERMGNSTVRPWTGRSGPVNVVFIAAAVRSDALAPRGPYRPALDHIDRLTLLVNSDDDALRFFRFLDCSQRAEALGYVGMPGRWLPPGVPFSSVDAAGIVGRTHGFPHYIESPPLMRRICVGATAGLETAAE